MPDINEILRRAQEQNGVVGEPAGPANPSGALGASAGVAADPRAIKNEVLNNKLSGEKYVDLAEPAAVAEDGWSMDRAYQNYVDRAGDNVLYGLGTMIKSYGNVVQALQGIFTEDWNGNALSNWMEKKGTSLEEDHQTFVSEHMQDPDFSIATYMNPEFWAVHGARFVPQLIEILGTAGLAGLARKGLQKGAKAVLGEVAEKAGKTTTKRLAGTGRAVNEVAGTGKGLVGRVLTDEGKFTKSFGELLETTTAGTLTNLRVSLANAGEMYNTYKGMLDEEGNPMFNEKELGEMAAGAFTNNMQYLAMDILSWGMTFGKGNLLRNMGVNPRVTSVGVENMKAAFSKSVSPIFRNMAKLGFKGVREGAEEMVQESWEEWAKIEAYRDKTGSLEGYEGKITEKYKRGIPGFFEYLQSSDSEAIRTIAFGMGAMAGGAFNVKTLFNRNADRARKMRDRVYALEQQSIDLNGQELQRQSDHIHLQIAELVNDGKSESFAGFINKLQERGNITEEEVEYYTQLHDDFSEEAATIQKLKTNGKIALMNEMAKQRYLEDKAEIERKDHEDRVAYLKMNVKDPDALEAKLAQEQADYMQIMSGVAYGIARHMKNKQSILNGRKAEEVELKDDKTMGTGSNGTQTPIVPETFKNNEDLRQIYEAVFSSVMNEGNEEGSQEEESELTPIEQAIEDPEGFMADLAAGQSIMIDGEDASVLEVGTNAEGAPDNFSYEMNETVDEEGQPVPGKTGNIRLTKKGTFFDDRTNRVSELRKYITKKPPKDDPDDKPAGGGAMMLDETPSGRESREPGQKSGLQTMLEEYEGIKWNNRAKNVTQNVFKKFTDTGEVPSGVLMKIVQDIAEGKQLSSEQEAIRMAYSEPVEKMLGALAIDNNQADQTKDLDDQTKEYIDQASKRMSKAISLADKAVKSTEKTINKAIQSIPESTRKKTKEIFSTTKKYTSKIWDKTKKKTKQVVDSFLSEEEETQPNATRTEVAKQRATQLGRQVKNGILKISTSAKEMAQEHFHRVNNRLGYKSVFDVAEYMGVNRALEQFFPDVKPRVYVLDSLRASIGTRGVGYSIAGAIFIDENSWKQDKTLMHEVSHVYYSLTQDEQNTKDLERYAMQNKPLVDRILRDYDDQIQYRYTFDEGILAGQSVIVSKGQMIEGYDLMNQDQRDMAAAQMEKTGKAQMLPMAQQHIIREEVFVATLEGQLSDTYNRYFQLKNDLGRKGRVKRWWGMLKKKAIDARTANQIHEPELMKALGKDAENYKATKADIIDGWGKAVAGRRVDASGRAAREAEEIAEVSQQILEIRSRRIQNQKEHVGKAQTRPTLPEEIEALQQERIEELDEGIYDPERSFNFNSLQYVQRAGKLVRQFNTAYGIAMAKRYYYQNKGNVTDWKRMPVYNGDLLHIKLNDLAHEATSADDYIRTIENSEIEELYEFNEFLNTTREDKEAVLAAMYHLNRNQHFVNSIKVFVSGSGNIDVQQSTNFTELTKIENQRNNIINQIGDYIRSKRDGESPTEVSRGYERFKEAAANIRANRFTQNDIRTVLTFFGGPQIEVDRIIDQGFVNLRGKTYPVNEVVMGFLTSPNGVGGVSRPETGFTKAQFAQLAKNQRSIEDEVYITGSKTIRKGVTDFIEALVVTNRPFTAEYTVSDANGNLKPARQVDNALLNITRQMQRDGLDPKMGQEQFIQKYAQVTKKLSKGKRSNALLGLMYNQIKAGGSVAINTYDGTVNHQTGNNGVTKESNATEQSFMELAMYMGSGYQNGRKKSTYLMELGRFSDSPRSFVMEVPRIPMKQLGQQTKTKGFVLKATPTLTATYEIQRNAGYNGTMNDYLKALNGIIQREFKFVEEQAEYASGLTQMENLFDKNGKLNAEGRRVIAEYTMNQHINGAFYQEIFLPSYKGANVVKRAKSLTSPRFNVGPNTRTEAIPILDQALDNIDEATDGAMYMREQDLQRVRNLGGNFMDIGFGLKGLHAGVEYNNSKFAGQNQYIKGHIFMLNEEIVEQNPDLKNVWDLLNARAKNFEEKMSYYEDDLSSDQLSHLPYAYHVSSDKANMMPPGFKRVAEAFALGEEMDMDTANTYLDRLYYTQGGSFVGLSGENFGAQLTMDKVTNTSNVSVQMMKAITANATANGKIEEAEALQSMLTGVMQEKLAEVDAVFEEGDPAKIRALIRRYMNTAEMDPIQAQSIEVDNLSFNTPELRMIARNQIANIIRMKGNKIVAPGTVAQQKPDHYDKGYMTNGNDKLSFYSEPTEQEMADIEKWENGRKHKVFRTGTRPMEGVVPSYMLQQGVKKREYYTLDDDKQPRSNNRKNKRSREERLEVLYRTAREIALKRGTKVGLAYNVFGKHVGFYVEGDKIIATRIPAHGPQTTGVIEVIDYVAGPSSNIQTPAEFALNTTGGDFDGDQLFVQHGQSGSRLWRNFMKGMTDYWLTPEMQAEVRLAINHKAMVEEAKQMVPPLPDDNIFFTPEKRRRDFHNTRSTSESIGIVASAHALIGQLSSYNVTLSSPISINGVEKRTFQDMKAGEGSRTIHSANLFNVILDNSKDQSAQVLGINNQTATLGTILINLGYDLGSIAQIFRSPVVEKYVELKSATENNFSPKYNKRVLGELKKIMGINVSKKNANRNIDLTSDINSDSNKEAIYLLLENGEKIQNDFIRLNGLLSQHTKMEINPFQLEEQIREFNKVVNNEGNTALTIPEGFRMNPLVQNYQNTAESLLSTLQKIDPVYRPSSARLYEVVVNGAPTNLSKNQKEHLYNLIELFHTSRMLGYNNIPIKHLKSLTDPRSENNIFNRLQSHMSKMAANIVRYNPQDPTDSVNELQASLLFSKMLNISTKGNNKFIKLNTSFYKENVDPSLKQRAAAEFSNLPTDLKNDLILYELMQHGFKGGASLFPILPDDVRQTVSFASDQDIQEKDLQVIDPKVMQQLLRAVLTENPNFSFVRNKKVKPFYWTKGKDRTRMFNPNFAKANPKIRENLVNGKPFYFINHDDGRIYYFRGGKAFLSDSNLLSQNSEDSRFDAAVKVASRHMSVLQLTPSEFNEGIIAIPDGEQTPYYEFTSKETVRTWDDHVANAKEQGGREARPGTPESNYWAYHYKMDRAQFDTVMNYDVGVTDDQKQIMYDGYESDYEIADKIYRETVNENTVKNKSDEELNELYRNYGQRNKFAFAKVLRPIVLEITNRSTQEQVLEYNGKQYDGKDISPIQKMLMSNNVPSNHPATQATVRKLEKAYKVYQVERTRMLKQINDATNELYQEQLGFKVKGGGIMDYLKAIYYGLTNMLSRDKFYRRLYGPLLDISVKLDEDGVERTRIKYKPKAEVDRLHEAGEISPAQYKFYQVTSQVSEEMRPHVVLKGEGRADYVPHVAPDLMEKLSRRGILGALVHSKTINEQIYDVHMDFTNPITGEVEKNVPFKYIEDVYNAVSRDKKASLSHSRDFVKLKRQAYKLYKTGRNQDNTPIRYTNIAVGTAIGDIFTEEFRGKNGSAAADLPSLDLNKAFNDYVTSALFIHGNDNFSGMKAMLPMIDGVLAQAQRDNNPNLEKYIDTVWREYFLKGSKKGIGKNSDTLLAMGVTSDDVVDFLTKGSLIYWLGWKGLAMGSGLYAIGNVLVGKYHNVKNASGAEWVKGEKRFWFGKSGKMNLRNPMGGVRESAAILKNIGFLDINIYDEVHASKKQSFDTMLSNIALAPMIKSEQWIQGVHFLGMLTDQEWDHVKNGGRLPWDRLNYLEEEVKRSHGKGYQPTDQRMLQMYSWGRAVLQFSRYLPTMAYDRLAKKDVDRYGRVHVGAYTAVWEPIQKMVTGQMTLAEFKNYYDTLDPDSKRRFNAGIKGFGFMTLLLGAQKVVGHSEYANDLYWDANALFNYDKLKWKTTPPSVAMLEQLTNF